MSVYKYNNIKCKIGYTGNLTFDLSLADKYGLGDCSTLFKSSIKKSDFTFDIKDPNFGFQYVEDYPAKNSEGYIKKICVQFDMIKYENNQQVGTRKYQIIGIENEKIKVSNLTDSDVDYQNSFIFPQEDKETSQSSGDGKSGGGTTSKAGRISYKKCDDNLQIGCSGNNVKVVQGYLANLGYNLGKYGEDGKFGRFTKAAVIKLQKDKNLPQTGVVDSETLRALESKSETSKAIKQQQDTSNSSDIKSSSNEPIRDVLDLRQQNYYGEKTLESMGVTQGEDMTQAKIALDNLLNKKYRDVSRQITVAEIKETANEVKENFPGLFSGSISESLYKNYHLNIISNRYDQVEKLVFERLVKNAN